MTDYLLFSGTGWDADGGLWGARQQIARELARTDRVLFVEAPASLETRRQRPGGRVPERGPILRMPEPNLYVFTPPPIPPGRWLAAWLNRIGQRRLARAVASVRRGLSIARPVLLLSHPYFVEQVGLHDERAVLYHATDDFAALAKGIRRRLLRNLETRLVGAATRTLAVPTDVHDRLSALAPDRVERFPAAADLDRFAPVREGKIPSHPALEGIPEPRFGQIGVFNERTDVALLAEIARAHPDWSFVLAGPVEWEGGWARLEGIPNVRFVDPVPAAEVPALLAGFRAGLVLYQRNALTDRTDPLKLHEYVAAGLPVIATPIAEVAAYTEIHPKRVRLAADVPSFAEAARVALDRPDAWERPDATALAPYGWAARAARIREIVRERAGQESEIA